MKKEGLYIDEAIINNFKNIEHRIVKLDGRSIIIAGKNGKGKSSLIQALMSPVDANYIPSHAIKNGEESGSIELKISGNIGGEDQAYNIDVLFSQQHQNGRLVLSDKDGNPIKKSIKSMIDSIIGDIGFDIFEFINKGITSTGKISKEGVRDQIETLRKIIPKEVNEAIYKMDVKKKQVYDSRTKNNSLLDVLEAEYKGCPYTEDEKVEFLEAQEKPTKPIEDKISKLTEGVENWNKVNNGTINMKDQLSCITLQDTTTLESMIATVNTALDNDSFKKDPLTNEIVLGILDVIDLAIDVINSEKEKSYKSEELKIKIAKGEAWLKKNEKPNISVLTKELEDANEYNRKLKDVSLYAEKHSRILNLKDDIKSQTEEFKQIEVDRKALFSSASMPVKGLSFTEDEIYYNDLPFNEDSQPKSTIIGVGVKIAMCLNPRLKVLVIRDGSLLDNDTLKMVLKMADKYGYQLLIEVVDNEHEVPEIKFTEDVIK